MDDVGALLSLKRGVLPLLPPRRFFPRSGTFRAVAFLQFRPGAKQTVLALTVFPSKKRETRNDEMRSVRTMCRVRFVPRLGMYALQ